MFTPFQWKMNKCRFCPRMYVFWYVLLNYFHLFSQRHHEGVSSACLLCDTFCYRQSQLPGCWNGGQWFCGIWRFWWWYAYFSNSIVICSQICAHLGVCVIAWWLRQAVFDIMTSYCTFFARVWHSLVHYIMYVEYFLIMEFQVVLSTLYANNLIYIYLLNTRPVFGSFG